MARKKKKNNGIVLVILILFLGLVLYILYNYEYKTTEKIESPNTSTKKETSTNEKKSDNSSKDANTSKQIEVNSEETPKNENEQNKVEEKVRDLNVSSIELIGEENITVSLNSEYKDQGAKAYNKLGEDISDIIKIENTVDTSKKGEYTVTYSIGNYIVMRFVTVQ